MTRICLNNRSSKADVFCLMGPTASGKTALALELVKRHPFQIISVDSAQVYRGMDIGTGKPDAGTLALAPHRLIDIRDPSEPYSAPDFRVDAFAQIDDILAAGDTPLLVGGTMLYFKVLRDGIADMPRADAQIRAGIEALARREGWEGVHRKLAQYDPLSAERIHPNDPQRLQRALEVYLASGKTMTQLREEERRSRHVNDSLLPCNLHFFAIRPADRNVLNQQIEQRFLRMLEAGLLEEVAKLYRRGDLHALLPSIKSVGYRQVWQHLAGDLNYDEMVEKSIIATRQLARRQLTWLRNWENLRELRGASAESVETILNYMA